MSAMMPSAQMQTAAVVSTVMPETQVVSAAAVMPQMPKMMPAVVPPQRMATESAVVTRSALVTTVLGIGR